MSSVSDLWSCFSALFGGNKGVVVDLDLSKISFERSFSSGSLRGELRPDVWCYLGGCSMFWVVNTGAFAVGVFGVWSRKAVSDHGSGDGSGSWSAVVMVVSLDHPWVCSVARSARSRPWKWSWVWSFSSLGAIGYGVFQLRNCLGRVLSGVGY